MEYLLSTDLILSLESNVSNVLKKDSKGLDLYFTGNGKNY